MKMSTTSSHADDNDFPPVDERLVAPGSGYEMVDGKLIRVAPADEPHAERHSRLAALLVAHVAKGFTVALDMLSRTSMSDDIAPDASVYPSARDPHTGKRQLEHLAFEIASTESLSHAAGKAAKLVERGVRRVFAISVEKERVFEWSRELCGWSLLDPTSTIEDRAFAVPLPVGTMVHALTADDEMATALLAKRNPVLVAALEERQVRALADGRAEGIATTILTVLERRGFVVTAREREQILAIRDPAKLDALVERVISCTSPAELLAAL